MNARNVRWMITGTIAMVLLVVVCSAIPAP